MSKDQEKAVKEVYRNFLNADYHRVKWTELDDRLWELSFLTNEETILEAEVQVYKHGLGDLKCAEDHSQSSCLVPQLMDAVNAILELYIETKELHEKNCYILHYYLSVSYMGLIYVDSED